MVTGHGVDSASAELSNLSAALWRIRELLDLLTYRIEVQRALSESGRARWLAHASTEVESLLRRIREAELLHAVEVGPAATALGLPEDASLAQLVAAAPAPWDHLLAEHRQALIDATTELTQSGELNRQLLDAGYQAVQAALVSLAGSTPAQTYSASGEPEHDSSPHLFDQSS